MAHRSTNAAVTKAVAAQLTSHYPSLRVEEAADGGPVFNTDDLDQASRERFDLDIAFFQRNSSLPLENICSHLSTYEPRTPSQKEMLDYAHRLISLKDDSRGAGLYMWGEAGIGKSHIAVGMAKKFMEQGLEAFFISADTYGFDTDLHLGSGQVWIIDDLNSGYGLASRLYKQVILHIHERGGRVFVTSNKPYDQLLHEMFVGDGDAERMRYDDRTKGLFKILHVVGDSFRQDTAWYHDDDSTETP